VIDIVLYIFKTLKFDNYTAQISLRDPNNREKYIGSDENWEKAESAIIRAAEEKGLQTVVEYGEAAFYGPKLGLHGKGRHRPQMATGNDPGGTTTSRSALRPDVQGSPTTSCTARS